MNVIAIIFSVLGSVVSGTALFLLTRYFKKRDDRDEKRDKAKARENFLVLKAIRANGKLTEATAISRQRGTINGEIHSALEGYKSVDAELYDYLLEQNANKN
jgi:hypothetical protein